MQDYLIQNNDSIPLSGYCTYKCSLNLEIGSAKLLALINKTNHSNAINTDYFGN